MLEQIAKQEYTRIDEEANQKKKTVDFICGYINLNYEKIESIFRQKKNKKDKEKKLYEMTKEMLMRVEDEATRYIGIVTCGSNKPLPPAMKVGLMEFKELGKRFTPKITLEGKRIINEYRKVKGLNSIEDSLEAQSRFWNN
ncbi:hypothetical protein M0R19_01200 [Candidatus Pacearchaeota archaeon]|jgi:predicted MarR family transcription regulator|nr:hypothetical protein [Candidatus Pacearchaeota archaeon]